MEAEQAMSMKKMDTELAATRLRVEPDERKTELFMKLIQVRTLPLIHAQSRILCHSPALLSSTANLLVY